MVVKDPAVDITRGLAVLLLVYGHVIQRTMAPWGEDFFLSPVFKWVYAFHMPLFFYISGYLTAKSLNRRSLSEVFRSRYNGVLKPFITWGILGVVTVYALNMIDGKSFDALRFPADCLDQLLINPVIWFLLTLFTAGCLLLASVYLQRKIGAVSFLVVYLCLMMAPENQYFALYYIQWFYPFYLAGYWVARSGWKLKGSWTTGLAVLALFTVLTLFWRKGDYIYIHKMNFQSDQIVVEWMRMIYRYGIGFLGIYWAMRWGEFWSGTKTGNVLANFGTYSLDIYLLQRYLVEGMYPRIIARFSWKIGLMDPVFYCVWAPVMALALTWVCLAFSRRFLRPYGILNGLLLGGRS